MVNTQNTEWRSLQDKGLLLYRGVKLVRTNFYNIVDEENSKLSDITGNRDEKVQESLISLYLKEDQVTIEVFLYKDEEKMSINTNVGAIELFGREPNDIEFSERVTLLDSMLEKLFVLQQDGRFHMKVENNAEPISIIQDRMREKQLAMEEVGYKSTSALKRRQFAD